MITKCWVVRGGSAVQAMAYTGGDAPHSTHACVENGHRERVAAKGNTILLPSSADEGVVCDLLSEGYTIAVTQYPEWKER